MEPYSGFADVYDLFMDNVPYDDWEELLTELFSSRGVTDGLVLELGCGTGTMTERMAARGYDMIGLDLSEEMLAAAAQKRAESAGSTLYLQQDMRRFELYGTVAGIFSVCDSLNYITKREELVQVFRLVNNYLDPDGVFVFDFTTPAYYADPARRHPVVEEQQGITLIWENDYDPRGRLNRHFVTIFLPVRAEDAWIDECDGPRKVPLPQGDDPVYVKEQELHVQRAYTPDEIRGALEDSGLRFETMLDAVTRGEPGPESQRIFCVAREQGKTKS